MQLKKFFTSNRPAQSMVDSANFDYSQLEKQRRSFLLQIITLALTCLAAGCGLVCLFLALFLAESGALLFVSGFCGFAIIGYFSAWLLAKKQKHYYKAVWLTVATLTTILSAIYFLFGTEIPVGVCFLMLLALLMVLVDEKLPLLIIAFYGTIYTVTLYVIQDFIKIYTPILRLNDLMEATLSLIALLGGAVGVIITIYLPLNSQLKTLHARTNRLQEALKELEIRQNAGQSVSRNVLALAAQLTSAAGEQAAGSQEQVATVTEVNSSVKELSATASQIAQIVVAVEKATGSMTNDSHLITTTTTSSVQQAKAGLQAVEHTVKVSQQVAELYRQLLLKTEELAQRSSRMRQILQLLDTISEETHLLSLNAAIEAAGAGQHGERFAVVAGEVKNLSQRSKKAGQEVVEIVLEIENFSQELTNMAQNGSNQANELETIAYQTGQRIEELQQVAQQAQQQANSITKKAEEVENLTQLIHVSTSQQSSASQQVLEALSDLLQVAQQGAVGSEVVANTAHHLENLSTTLNSTLTVLPAPAAEQEKAKAA